MQVILCSPRRSRVQYRDEYLQLTSTRLFRYPAIFNQFQWSHLSLVPVPTESRIFPRPTCPALFPNVKPRQGSKNPATWTENPRLRFRCAQPISIHKTRLPSTRFQSIERRRAFAGGRDETCESIPNGPDPPTVSCVFDEIIQALKCLSAAAQDGVEETGLTAARPEEPMMSWDSWLH